MTSKGCNAVSRRPCVKGISSKEQMSIVFTDTRLTALIDTLGSTIEHLPAAPVELYTLCIYKDLLEPWLSALRRQRTEVSPRPHCRKLSVGKKKWGISVTYVYWECWTEVTAVAYNSCVVTLRDEKATQTREANSNLYSSFNYQINPITDNQVIS